MNIENHRKVLLKRAYSCKQNLKNICFFRRLCIEFILSSILLFCLFYKEKINANSLKGILFLFERETITYV
jgi:hypothetical protein